METAVEFFVTMRNDGESNDDDFVSSDEHDTDRNIINIFDWDLVF